jgi:YegS/Rv2252/BmrU family lipid kinase
MVPSPKLDILFILNPRSGGIDKTNWEKIIAGYFKTHSYQIEIFILTGKDDAVQINDKIKKDSPQKIVAVGGDGTVSLVAQQLLHSSIPMGILHGGSANAMATDLKIPENNFAALDTILKGSIQKCDVIKINENEMSIHLSDLGLNAKIVKYFHQSSIHGMWGYARFFIKILLWAKPVLANISTDEKEVKMKIFMIVIANAKKYGTGAIINPEGLIDDGKFELVVVRKISILEMIKMFLNSKPFNPKNVQIIQTTKAVISTKRKTDFQIDGEYEGKTNKVSAQIIPSALNIIVPDLYDAEESHF